LIRFLLVIMHMSSDLTPTPPWFEVRESSIHNRGVFAATDIPPETRIMEYFGERITKRESERRGLALIEKAKQTGEAAVYIFTLNSRYDLDGALGENPARYINHSCDPNCEAYIEKGRIFIYSKRAIEAGEELCYNYGFDLDTWEDHPCRCGTDRCMGYIVDEQHWPKLKQKLKGIIYRGRAKKAAAVREARGLEPAAGEGRTGTRRSGRKQEA
jgi:SET domain-containing protein